MSFSNLIFSGAIFGVIISVWGQIKELAFKFFSLFVQTVTLQDVELSSALVGYLKNNYKMVNVYQKIYFRHYMHLNSYNKYGNVATEDYKSSDQIFMNGKWPLFYKPISKDKTSDVKSQPNHTSYVGQGEVTGAKVYFIRGTWDIDKILGEANHKENERYWHHLNNNETKRFSIVHLPAGNEYMRNSEDPTWYISPANKILFYDIKDIGFKDDRINLLSRLVFPDHVNKVIGLVEKWHKNRVWFEARGIPWKSGLLLHGPAGTGKSALTRAIGMKLDLPIYSFRLSEMTSRQFVDGWKTIQKSSPCIALFEDLDSVFHGRENVSHVRDILSPNRNRSDQAIVGQAEYNGIESELTFDTFINSLDGIERYEGVFIIITTNDISKIDPAIANRPGRIDKVVELTYLTNNNKIELAKKVLGDSPNLLKQMMEYIDKTKEEKISPASFQNKCIELALGNFMEVS